MAKAKETLSERVYTSIYDDITGLKLRCGQKLTLKSLAEMYEVSYTPIREALSRLSENGLVTYYSNCGVKVIEFSDDDIVARAAGQCRVRQPGALLRGIRRMG